METRTVEDRLDSVEVELARVKCNWEETKQMMLEMMMELKEDLKGLKKKKAPEKKGKSGIESTMVHLFRDPSLGHSKRQFIPPPPSPPPPPPPSNPNRIDSGSEICNPTTSLGRNWREPRQIKPRTENTGILPSPPPPPSPPPSNPNRIDSGSEICNPTTSLGRNWREPRQIKPRTENTGILPSPSPPPPPPPPRLTIPPQQLEATPITTYGTDPELLVGRQIAVSKHYVCYGLKGGNVRVLNLNIAARSLLCGHTKRVTDMGSYADDVHLLASVGVDGRVYVWKICEGPDEQDKLQITGNAIIAIHFLGEGEGDCVHPQVCWHCNRQDILFVGIGKYVLRIDIAKVSKAEGFSAEAPLQCSVNWLIDGIQLVGRHDGEVTDLSMNQWTTTHLVSASTDGQIKIWEEGKAAPLTVLKPHGGQPVNLAQFLAAPYCDLVSVISEHGGSQPMIDYSFDGYLLVLLTVGPSRAFTRQVSQIIEDDFILINPIAQFKKIKKDIKGSQRTHWRLRFVGVRQGVEPVDKCLRDVFRYFLMFFLEIKAIIDAFHLEDKVLEREGSIVRPSIKVWGRTVNNNRFAGNSNEEQIDKKRQLCKWMEMMCKWMEMLSWHRRLLQFSSL